MCVYVHIHKMSLNDRIVLGRKKIPPSHNPFNEARDSFVFSEGKGEPLKIPRKVC